MCLYNVYTYVLRWPKKSRDSVSCQIRLLTLSAKCYQKTKFFLIVFLDLFLQSFLINFLIVLAFYSELLFQNTIAQTQAILSWNSISEIMMDYYHEE